MAAQRYSAAQLESMAIQAENETAKLRGDPPLHHQSTEEEDEEEREAERQRKVEKKRTQMLNAARALIDSGVDPEIAARMMLQIPGQGQPVTTQPTGHQPSLAELTEAMLNLKELSKSDNRDDKFMELIDQMREDSRRNQELLLKVIERMSEGGKGEKVDPVQAASNQAKAMREFHSSMIEYATSLGYAPRGEGVTQTRDINEVKENNRHEEEILRIKSDQNYKESIAETLSDLPVTLGGSIAHNMRESAGKESSKPVSHQSEPGGVESHVCNDCGTKIYAPPGVPRIRCPKCGKEYEIDWEKSGMTPPKQEG